jgi:hypothetical protein
MFIPGGGCNLPPLFLTAEFAESTYGGGAKDAEKSQKELALRSLRKISALSAVIFLCF